MALTLTNLLTEFYARGFDYLNDGSAGTTRATRWINDAMHQIDDAPEGWPYLYTSSNYTTPAAFTDLARVKSVQYQNQPLTYASYEWLANQNMVGATGTPVYYYIIENAVALRTVYVFPNQVATVNIGYLRTVPDLVAGSDTPWIPDRFRYAIVDYAVAKGLRDKSNYQEAAAAKQAGDETMQAMRDFYNLLPGGFDQQQLQYVAGDW